MTKLIEIYKPYTDFLEWLYKTYGTDKIEITDKKFIIKIKIKKHVKK
jgi:hypothetical protein